MSSIGAMLSDLRQMGVVPWALYALDRALDRLSKGRARLWSFRFFAQPVPSADLVNTPSSGKSRFAVLEPGEIPASLFGRPSGAIEERFRGGSTCIAALNGNELSGFMWLQFGALRERLVACDFEPLPANLTCWDYDLEVLPRYRLGRTFARLWDEAFRVLRKRGVQATVSWIAFSNVASRRAHERMGARQVGWLVVLDLFGFKFAAQSTAPFVMFSPAGHRLRIRVDITKHLPALAAEND